MIFCKKCGYMLDDDAKFCTECGTPTSDDATTNPNPNPNPDPSQNPNPNNVPPYNGQGYYYNPQGGYPPPYNQPPYGYYPPQKRPINVGLLIFTIINFVLVGIIALWPLLTLLKARDAHDDVSEEYQLEKAKNANIVCLVIGILLFAISFITETVTLLLG